MHGYVEFSDPPEHFTYPLSFPVADWPKKNDPAFIGIFYSKCRIGSIRPTDFDQRAPGVYFRYFPQFIVVSLFNNSCNSVPQLLIESGMSYCRSVSSSEEDEEFDTREWHRHFSSMDRFSSKRYKSSHWKCLCVLIKKKEEIALIQFYKVAH